MGFREVEGGGWGFDFGKEWKIIGRRYCVIV